MQILHIDKEFPPFYGDTITIPEHTIFFRAYSSLYPTISKRPAYFGNSETAMGYVNGPDKVLGAFKTTRPLQLLDYRFMKVILKQFFEEITGSSKLAKEDFNAIRSVIFSFGLCSLENQIRMLDNFPTEYENKCPGFKELRKQFTGASLIEKPGIRIGETTNDAFTMGFLQGLFEGLFDGFISPELKTVFHVEKGGVLSPEIILFNPLKSGIEQQILTIPNGTPKLSVYSLIHKNVTRVTIVSKDVQTKLFMKRGGNTHHQISPHSFEDVEENIRTRTKKVIGNYMKGLRSGRKCGGFATNKFPYISYSIAPSPRVEKELMTGIREPLPIV